LRHQQHGLAAGITCETVTALVMKGLILRNTGGHLALTDRGRAVPGAIPGSMIIDGDQRAEFRRPASVAERI
jgi:hypothetical protein